MFTIEQASLIHLDELSQLFNSYRLFYKKNADLEGAKHFINERITKNESVIYISVESGKLIGFVQLYPIFSSTRMKRLWLLNDLFVDEKHRGKGVSTALINKCKELCKSTNACGLMLETSINNFQANKLYVKEGFELEDQSNFYSWNIK